MPTGPLRAATAQVLARWERSRGFRRGALAPRRKGPRIPVEPSRPE